jgi:hypothetical protein
MTLSPKILTLSAQVARFGLQFQNDKEPLKAICAELAAEVAGRPWIEIQQHIVAGLKACDAHDHWQTNKVRPTETDAQRQAREDQVYAMLATIYLMATEGVRVGL